MLSWLPIVGPILQSILSSVSGIYLKYKDTELGKYQTDADVRKTEVAASTQQLIAFKDDPGLKVLRDTLIFPVVVWSGLSFWDKIVEKSYPMLVWGVQEFPVGSTLSYLPHAVMIFLLGNLYINRK